MQNMFKKANATNSNEAHFQQQASKETAAADSADSGSTLKQMGAGKKTKSAASQKDTEMDMELVLYEFVEVIVRIASGAPTRTTASTSSRRSSSRCPIASSRCSRRSSCPTPSATTRRSSKRLRRQGHPVGARGFNDKLKVWYDVHTQSMFLQGKGRKLQYQQWQDLLKKGWGEMLPNNEPAPGTPPRLVGNWQIYQDSEITGDERCRNIFKVSLAPAGKFAFINSQGLDQLTVVKCPPRRTSTLDFDEFKGCIALRPRQVQADQADVGRRPHPPSARTCSASRTLRSASHGDAHQGAALPVEALLATAARSAAQGTQKCSRCGSASRSPTCTTPLWEKGVHDLLQKHFNELSLIFLAYCRSLLGSDTAEDAMEMEMSEFKDFIDKCRRDQDRHVRP